MDSWIPRFRQEDEESKNPGIEASSTTELLQNAQQSIDDTPVGAQHSRRHRRAAGVHHLFCVLGDAHVDVADDQHLRPELVRN